MKLKAIQRIDKMYNIINLELNVKKITKAQHRI